MDNHRHFVLHKPAGYLSQFVSNQSKQSKKRLLGELHDFPEGTMPVGRLDEDSEGLLLLTTDGKLSEQIRSQKVEKEYYVKVDGEITDDAVEQLQQGVEISIYGKKYKTLPCKARRLNTAPDVAPARRKRSKRHGPTSWIAITIKEGKFRQVRKMTAAVGFPTLRLIRIRVGPVSLNELSSGEVLEVSLFQLNPYV